MKVFISWSKDRSRIIAEYLRDWLPLVIQSVDPWVSSQDIPKGKRWDINLNNELEGSNFGILCVTIENRNEPWLLYEAGALSKLVKESSVVPYLINLEPIDLTGPLTMFQSVKATEADTFQMVRAINSECEARISERQLSEAFEAFWGRLENYIKALPPSEVEKPQRETNDVLDEILRYVRNQDRRYRSEITDIRSSINRLRQIDLIKDTSTKLIEPNEFSVYKKLEFQEKILNNLARYMYKEKLNESFQFGKLSSDDNGLFLDITYTDSGRKIRVYENGEISKDN